MKRTTRWGSTAFLAMALAVVNGAAANKKTMPSPAKTSTESPADLLAAGVYTAKMKAFVCGGCADWVKERLTSVPGLSNVRAEQSTARVEFTVDKPVSRKLIQKTLDGAAREMGMGADYTLGELKPKLK